MLEFNEVILPGEPRPLTLMAPSGRVTTIRGTSRWLYAILGLEPITSGFISIDGEPLTPHSASKMRRLMAFVPSSLPDVGQLDVYAAPTSADVFALWANRSVSVDAEELRATEQATGLSGQDASLLATSALLRRPILLVEYPKEAAMPFLQRQAEEGITVVVCVE